MTMSKVQIILVIVYAVGVWLSRAMLQIQHEAEGKTYTKLDHILCMVFSLLSFLMVLTLLVATWFKSIAATGYWNTPVKPESK